SADERARGVVSRVLRGRARGRRLPGALSARGAGGHGRRRPARRATLAGDADHAGAPASRVTLTRAVGRDHWTSSSRRLRASSSARISSLNIPMWSGQGGLFSSTYWQSFWLHWTKYPSRRPNPPGRRRRICTCSETTSHQNSRGRLRLIQSPSPDINLEHHTLSRCSGQWPVIARRRFPGRDVAFRSILGHTPVVSGHHPGGTRLLRPIDLVRNPVLSLFVLLTIGLLSGCGSLSRALRPDATPTVPF